MKYQIFHTFFSLSFPEESRQYIYRCNNRQTDKLMPRRPPPPIPVDSYPRNISFSDDSVTANTTVASSRFPGFSPKTSTFYQTPKRQHEVFTISGRNKNMFLESHMTTPGMAYSVGDIDTMSEMATCRDDASTTTSGSYTINPDDLCNEIDDLFFRDVIVWSETSNLPCEEYSMTLSFKKCEKLCQYVCIYLCVMSKQCCVEESRSLLVLFLGQYMSHGHKEVFWLAEIRVMWLVWYEW